MTVAGRRGIKVSDLVVETLVRHGVTDIFLVSGGGIMHLTDSVGRHSGIRYTCNFHEQASAIAAEGYSRVKNAVGVCLVTTGPGATNALSGVVGAWFDSIPVVVLSGQVRIPLIADYSRLRQLGPQEVNVLPMARDVTKFATSIREPASVRREIEKALTAAVSGRPGPVWLEFPLDMQAAVVEESALEPAAPPAPRSAEISPELREAAGKVIEELSRARRPVFLFGNGVRLAGAENELARLLDNSRIPILLTMAGMDLVPDSNQDHLGAFGPVGRRSSNFALQNSDLLLAVGAGLPISAIGFNAAAFAPKARKILVNVDANEMRKGTVAVDVAIEADARAFLSAMLEALGDRRLCGSDRWREACRDWKRRYPTVPEGALDDPGFVNSYVFVDRLSDLLTEGDVLVTGNSLDAVSVYQTFRVRAGQRVLFNVNYGAMGWDLPAAVGAAVANRPRRTILVTGDGSLQFNVQELQTVRQNDLPLKVFVYNNDGYESIRTTQTAYFEGRFVGADRASGIGNPDFEKLAAAYGIPYVRVATNAGLAALGTFLEAPGPGLCELLLSPTQARNPRVTSARREDGTMESRPLEDMFPFLPREEIRRNMHLFDDEEAG